MKICKTYDIIAHAHINKHIIGNSQPQISSLPYYCSWRMHGEAVSTGHASQGGGRERAVRATLRLVGRPSRRGFGRSWGSGCWSRRSEGHVAPCLRGEGSIFTCNVHRNCCIILTTYPVLPYLSTSLILSIINFTHLKRCLLTRDGENKDPSSLNVSGNLLAEPQIHIP